MLFLGLRYLCVISVIVPTFNTYSFCFDKWLLNINWNGEMVQNYRTCNKRNVFFWHLLWLMLPERVHGGVWFKMSDVEPVAPQLLDEVTREKASSSAQKAVANPHLWNQGQWRMPRCVLKWSWRREGFVTDGFLLSGACPALSLENDGLDPEQVRVESCCQDRKWGPGWCARGSCCRPAGRLALQHWLPEVWWGRCVWFRNKPWAGKPSLEPEKVVTTWGLLACLGRSVSHGASWYLCHVWWDGDVWVWQPQKRASCLHLPGVPASVQHWALLVGGLGCPLWH